LAAVLAPGCNQPHGSCSVPVGGSRCDGNVVVTCHQQCDSSGCDTVAISEDRTDCGPYATCVTDNRGTGCLPTGKCGMDTDCCAPTLSPFCMQGPPNGNRCKQGVCTFYLMSGSPCDQDPTGCEPNLRCLPPGSTTLDAGLADGGAASDSAAADASPDGADASSVDGGAGRICQ
jgi:hypothetical protein